MTAARHLYRRRFDAIATETHNVSQRKETMRAARWTIVATVGWVTSILGCGASSQESALPRTFQLGGSADTLRPLIARDCEQTKELRHTGQMAAPFDEQVQIDCLGLEVFGARRKVEFMFNDGPLGHVWVHIRAEEATEIRGILEKAFGQVVYETEIDKIFASGTVALRLRPPEVLVATPVLIAELTGYRGDSR